MRFSLRIFPVLSCHSVLVLRVLAADAPSPTALAAAPPPRDWIDPDTRHRVIRLSPDQGGSSLYFHQNGYTPEGDKLILHTRDGALATVDLTTLGLSPPKLEIVAPATRAIAAGTPVV